jgi:hypothetical protein
VKLQIILVASVVGLSWFAAPAAAQRGGGGKGSGDPESTALGVQHTAPNAGSKYADFLCGTVKDVSKDELVLTKTQMGEDQSFRFTKKTKFILDGKDSSLASVHLGDKVWVDVVKDKKTGELFARKVVAGVFLMSPN